MSLKTRQVTSGQLKPYVVGQHRPGVVNDVFNGMSTLGLVACYTALGQQCDAILLCHQAL
jgi:hypothetical protein